MYLKVKQNANIELHDIRLVVGSKIEDRYDTLRKDWFGSLKRLHIHSYKKIQYINGYKVDLLNMESKKKQLVKKIIPPKIMVWQYWRIESNFYAGKTLVWISYSFK